jgi:hypothetical protein
MKMRSWWRCRTCEKKLATWIYMPAIAGENFLACEDCVPRGCSCNEPDDKESPCCEWWPVTEEDIKENPYGYED